MPGISESLIEDHEEPAELALVLTQLTGLAALGTLLFGRKNARVGYVAANVTFALSLVTFAVLGYVANTGGKISHPELRNGEDQTIENLEEDKVLEYGGDYLEKNDDERKHLF